MTRRCGTHLIGAMADVALLSDRGRDRMRQMVHHVESRSSAEVVVVARAVSRQWRILDLAAGALASYGALVFMLFAEMVFELWQIAALVPLVFLLGVSFGGGTRRWTIGWLPRAWRADAVDAAARTAFVDHGVANTRERTGILVYVAVAEGLCAVVADEGVKARISEKDWTEMVTNVERAAASRNAETLSIALGGWADVLARVLPRTPGDRDELVGVA